MKAIVVRSTGGPEVLAGETVPDPHPQPREVLIKVAACGVCFHDVVTRNGTLKAGVALPFIPGHEIAGTVVEVGRDVTAFHVGERVASTQRSHICGHCRYCRTGREPLCSEARFLGDAGLNGGYAEYVAIESDNLAHVPEEVPLDAAAIAACAIGTVFHAIGSVGKVALGETVLVTGAGGGLGIHAVQVARRAGGFVLGQTTSPAKIDTIRSAGAHAVILSEPSGDFSARRSLARGGRWVLVGQLTGEFVPFNPAQLFLKGISLLSSTSTTREELVQVLALLQRGELKPVIAETLPLEQASSAHRLLESGRALGRVILKN
jgi:D-arabinose 1-dehydrogenase-like Zn-dependent alcohol dehydrogenase